MRTIYSFKEFVSAVRNDVREMRLKGEAFDGYKIMMENDKSIENFLIGAGVTGLSVALAGPVGLLGGLAGGAWLGHRNGVEKKELAKKKASYAPSIDADQFKKLVKKYYDKQNYDSKSKTVELIRKK